MIAAATFTWEQYLEELARYATIPVINGLSDFSHPCQALGDFLTISEKKGRLQGLKLAYIGGLGMMAGPAAQGPAEEKEEKDSEA